MSKSSKRSRSRSRSGSDSSKLSDLQWPSGYSPSPIMRSPLSNASKKSQSKEESPAEQLSDLRWPSGYSPSPIFATSGQSSEHYSSDASEDSIFDGYELKKSRSPLRREPPVRNLTKEFLENCAEYQNELALEAISSLFIPTESDVVKNLKETPKKQSGSPQQAENPLGPVKQVQNKPIPSQARWFVVIAQNLTKLVNNLRGDSWNKLCSLMDDPAMYAREDERRQQRLSFIDTYIAEISTFETFFTRVRRNGLYTLLIAYRDDCQSIVDALETEVRQALMALVRADDCGNATYIKGGTEVEFRIAHNKMMKTVILDLRKMLDLILQTIDTADTRFVEDIPLQLSKMRANILFHCQSDKTSTISTYL